MNDYQVEVRITPRAGLLDPEGQAVQHALHALDFGDVGTVRVGRLVRLTLSAGSDTDARGNVEAMCRKLLANPVTEDFEINVTRAG